MGGVFSTRWNSHRKRRTVESCRTLDLNLVVREARRSSPDADPLARTLKGELAYGNGDVVRLSLLWKRVLVPSTGETFVGALELVYPWRRNEGGGEEVHEETLLVPVSLSELASGGKRLYLHCPLVRPDGAACLARVVRLYQPRGGQHFGCRKCHRLTYRSAQEHDARVDRIARDLSRGSYERYERLLTEAMKTGAFLTEAGLFLKAARKLEKKELRK